MRGIKTVAILAGLSPLWIPILAGATGEPVDPVATHRIQQQAAATRTDLYSPYFSVAGQDSTSLVFVAAVNDPVEVAVTAFDVQGEPWPLGDFVIPVSRHLSIDLREQLRHAPGRFRQGSLRVTFLGSVETLQAWALLELDGSLTEFTLLAPTEFAATSLLTFWGDGAPGEKHEIYLLNAGTQNVSFVETRSVDGMGHKRPWVLAAGERRMLSILPPGPGWLQVEHDGNPGDLIVLSLERGLRHLEMLPVWTLPVSPVSTWEAVRVPTLTSAPSEASLTLFNGSNESSRADLVVLSADGVNLRSIAVEVAAGGVEEVPLAALMRGVEVPEARLRVSSDRAGLLVQGRAEVAEGSLAELSFFDHAQAHASGTYPLLSPEFYATEVTWVNLGDEDAKVVAQFYWDSGTYALGPIEVAAGTSHKVSIDDVVADGVPDLLGRRLPHRLTNGLFKWKVHAGSRSLLGRAESSERESGDRIGFNCLGCCWESPVGTIEPAYVEFDVGQSVPFVACVTYQTCNGPMGPYETSPSSTWIPTPFSWSGLDVSATGAAQATLSFLAWGEEVASTCNTIDAPYGASGVANSCKLHLRKAHNPLQHWETSQACTQQVAGEPAGTKCDRCNSCCKAQKDYNTCKGVNQNLVQSEYNACIGLCLIEYCS